MKEHPQTHFKLHLLDLENERSQAARLISRPFSEKSGLVDHSELDICT